MTDRPRALAPTFAQVIFSQLASGDVTTELDEAEGPLIAGEHIVAYEIDEPTLWAWAQVETFDASSGVATLKVDWETMSSVSEYSDSPPRAGETASQEAASKSPESSQRKQIEHELRQLVATAA